MNKRIKELMLLAGYAAPEIATRAQKLAELLVKDIQLTVASGVIRGIPTGQVMQEIRETFEYISNNTSEHPPFYSMKEARNFVEKEIKRRKATETLSEPQDELDYFIFHGQEPNYESNGQFSGGISTAIYEHKGDCYEFTFNKDELIEGIRYPIEYKEYD